MAVHMYKYLYVRCINHEHFTWSTRCRQIFNTGNLRLLTKPCDSATISCRCRPTAAQPLDRQLRFLATHYSNYYKQAAVITPPTAAAAAAAAAKGVFSSVNNPAASLLASVPRACRLVARRDSRRKPTDLCRPPPQSFHTSQPTSRDASMPSGAQTDGDFIGAIDQGTTSSRFLIFDRNGNPVASHQVEFAQIFPHSGWVEHDPHDILSSVELCIEEATKKFTKLGYKVSDIKAIGITNQRETTLVWDTSTGAPLYNAIVWSDTRTNQLVHELRKKDGFSKVYELTGIPLSTYPSSVKLLWLLRHIPSVRKSFDEGHLAFGTVDSWLLYNFTGGINGGLHITDPSNASRTMFMNINTLRYDDFLVDFFGVRGVTFPKIIPSSDPDGYSKIRNGGIMDGIRIASCLGDQSAALVGHCAFTPGMAKNTYGTGCFLLYNTGTSPVISKNGLVTTVGYAFKDQKPVYALEGSIAVAGSAVKFLRDNLKLIKHSAEIGELASQVPDSGGLVFVTAFSGLFAPYWIDDCRGTIFGLTQYTSISHLCRATLEAVCYQTRALVDAMQKDIISSENHSLDHQIKLLLVDGGMSASDFTMQLQSNIIGLAVERPAMKETTALGAAIAAGLAVGVFKDLEDLKGINREERIVFKSSWSERRRNRGFALWNRAVEKGRGWLSEEDGVDTNGEVSDS